MQIDFSKLVRDQNGKLPKRVKTKDGEVVKDEDDKPVQVEQEVEVGDHVIDFLNYAVQDSNSLVEINALKGIMSDIARGETEYSEDDIELIKEKIDEQLPLEEQRSKPSIVLTSIAELLDT